MFRVNGASLCPGDIAFCYNHSITLFWPCGKMIELHGLKSAQLVFSAPDTIVEIVSR